MIMNQQLGATQKPPTRHPLAKTTTRRSMPRGDHPTGRIRSQAKSPPNHEKEATTTTYGHEKFLKEDFKNLEGDVMEVN